MENRNIYKLDDVLLYLSLILLVPAVFFAWPWLKEIPNVQDMGAYIQDAPAVIGNELLYVLSYLAGAVLTQIAGRSLRYQEKLSLKILDEVGYSRKVRISEISSRLGMSEGKVEKLVRKLSRVKSLNIGIEGDRIVRSRASGKSPSPEPAAQRTEVVQEQSEESTDDLSSRMEELKNSSTVKNLKTQDVDLVSMMEQMKKTGEKPDLKELHRKVREARENGSTVSRSTEENSKSQDKPFGCLGMGLLILLFMTPLWPIPLIIIIRKAVKQRGAAQNSGE
ncbi:MAG: hypothetical protein PQJ58_12955 [Spirochaetales bacterium]|nr:hypothetical protein [Spirochaetales bacterium]